MTAAFHLRKTRGREPRPVPGFATKSSIHSPIKENFHDFNHAADVSAGIRTSKNAVFIARGSIISEGNRIAVKLLSARESSV